MTAAPVIETPRLRLRPHRGEDFEACFAMWSDPIVTRFIGGTPSTASQTWIRLLAYIGHWSAMGFGYWAIEEKTSASYVGEGGFADFKRDVPGMQHAPELGFAFIPAVYGQGYASEAVRAIVEWGDAHLQTPRTVCMIVQANAASLRVAEKSGYEVFDRGSVKGEPTLFLQRCR